MEGLRQLDMVGDISPAVEATEDFIHCMDGIHGQGLSQGQTGVLQASMQPRKLQEVSGAALAKLSSSGVWSLLAGEQPEVGPLGLAWADNLSVLGLGVGLRNGKRSRARSTNDLAAHGKEGNGTSSNSTFKKGHNRSRSDVNYRPSAYTDNGLLTVDTVKNSNLQHQHQGEKSSSSSVLKQAEMEHREGQRGRWTMCHVELTPCELRLYTLDSSANRQLGTAYSLSHCQSVMSPAPCGQVGQPADPRTLQTVFFNSTRVQLRAGSQWEAMEWRQLMWEKVQAVRPERQGNRQRKAVVEKVATFPAPMSPSSSPSRSDGDSDTSAEVSLRSDGGPLSRPTTLPLFSQRCQDVFKAGLLHQLLDQNNWRTLTFVLTRTALQAFPTEGRGSVSHPVRQYPLASCLGVHPDPEQEEPWTDRGDRFRAVFPNDMLRLRADTKVRAQEWMEALRDAVGAQQPAREEGDAPALQGVLLRSRERRHRDAQRAKRQSVTTSFLSLLTCVAVEKGLTAQSFRCADLDEVMQSKPRRERAVIGADFNGHVGAGNRGDEEAMGRFGIQERNAEGQMVVDFAKRMEMAIVNTCFQKRQEHRVTYKSGGRSTQLDYILCRCCHLKEISDCKVVVGHSVAKQHRMVVGRMTLVGRKMKRTKTEQRTKWWKLKKESVA
ncbi:pleckstrin homology domain-containing family M member 3 isoform X3 [Dunckerocampus dactyliophorus]|uniref:pleckstrin homology domain-containing family M member 3 isoform X3 n=1 Tax=Dunckerocampus dactyliophorus TaxID=161453 RepID=UPI0024074B54|nr:pleckstrin homology domain-containing family M member 3 isoform X3 [Dunckerocampus dactyliophorus]